MGKTIMIVEDDQIFHDIYSEMLEDTDFPQSAMQNCNNLFYLNKV